MKIRFAAIAVISGATENIDPRLVIKTRDDGRTEALLIYHGNDRSTHKTVTTGMARECRQIGCKLEDILQIEPLR